MSISNGFGDFGCLHINEHFLKGGVLDLGWVFFPLKILSLKFPQAQGWFELSRTFPLHLQPESKHLSFGKEKHLSWKLL